MSNKNLNQFLVGSEANFSEEVCNACFGQRQITNFSD
jgi:hypothetical protein